VRSADPAESGFTLIEMLVVLTIISVLAGLTLVGLQKARVSGDESATQNEIIMLASRIDAFASGFGSPPPSSLSEIRGIKGNGINEGNECLFGCLLSKKKGGPFATDLKEDRWKNVDADELKGPDWKTIQKEMDWSRGTPGLLEYIDIWGNPFIYIQSRDYGKKLKYQAEGGEVFEVEARKNPATGTWMANDRFQLWSLGPDGINQNGEGDDIVSWK